MKNKTPIATEPDGSPHTIPIDRLATVLGGESPEMLARILQAGEDKRAAIKKIYAQ